MSPFLFRYVKRNNEAYQECLKIRTAHPELQATYRVPFEMLSYAQPLVLKLNEIKSCHVEQTSFGHFEVAMETESDDSSPLMLPNDGKYCVSIESFSYPACSCGYWELNLQPCVHMFAVFKMFPSRWTYDSLSACYRSNPTFQLDYTSISHYRAPTRVESACQTVPPSIFYGYSSLEYKTSEHARILATVRELKEWMCNAFILFQDKAVYYQMDRELSQMEKDLVRLRPIKVRTNVLHINSPTVSDSSSKSSKSPVKLKARTELPSSSPVKFKTVKFGTSTVKINAAASSSKSQPRKVIIRPLTIRPLSIRPKLKQSTTPQKIDIPNFSATTPINDDARKVLCDFILSNQKKVVPAPTNQTKVGLVNTSKESEKCYIETSPQPVNSPPVVSDTATLPEYPSEITVEIADQVGAVARKRKLEDGLLSDFPSECSDGSYVPVDKKLVLSNTTITDSQSQNSSDGDIDGGDVQGRQVMLEAASDEREIDDDQVNQIIKDVSEVNT